MLTEERTTAIFEEMDSYVLELASEPSMLGPQYFQDIIAKCRGCLNKVSLVLSELNREKLEVSSELRKLEAAYALDYDDLLANDDAVKRLANIDDRKSTVGYLLRSQRQKINELKDRLHSLDAVYKVATHRNRELHATMNAIKDQRRLMVTEISTGAFYGDERVSRKKEFKEPAGLMAVDDLSDEDLEALLSDGSKDAEEPTKAEGVPDASTQGIVQEKPSTETTPEIIEAASTPEEEEVLRFLDGVSAPAPPVVVPPAKNEDDDLNSLLEGL